MINFRVENKLKNVLGRAGVLTTPHGVVQTPAFVPVGTKATIKALTPEQVEGTLSQIILANTYHLHLQPGEEIVKESGGLHGFMNWQGPMMTDSGGFQAFSLGIAYGEGIGKFISAVAPAEKILENEKEKLAKVSEEGIEFASIIDGGTHFLSPEKSIQIQHDLGADIIFALDEFTSPHADEEQIRKTIERTQRWAGRCLEEHRGNQMSTQQGLFGIVQGGRYENLRKQSAAAIGSMDFDGFGIGGTFVKEDMATAVRWVNEILPRDLPRHLLGVGEPIDIFLGVENGCDTFDCVAPTRMARNGALYTKEGKINVTNAKYINDLSPIENDCRCYTCRNYTVAYLSHLFRSKEMLGATLATIHNLYFINSLFSQIRQSILENRFEEFKDDFFHQHK